MADNKRRDAPFLPHEIVMSILILLPASSLFRFRIVCKSWFSSITDPAFIAAHTKRCSTLPSTFMAFMVDDEDRSALHFFDYASCTGKTLRLTQLIPSYHSDDDDYENPYTIIRSVNGLQLLYSSTIIYVCNTCTRDIVALPPIHADRPVEDDFPRYGKGLHGLGLVKGRHKSLGFGIDPSTGKYKVVKLALARNSANSSCHVFTQGSQSWREIACPDYASYPFIGFDSVFVNGVFYWETEEYYADLRGWVVSLDLAEEKFTLFRSPPVKNYYDSRSVECLQGELCIVDSTATDALHIVVWTRSDEKWIRRYTIKNPGIDKEDAAVFEIHDGKILIATNGDLFSYDPNEEKFSNLGWDKHRENNWELLFTVFCKEGTLFAETLAPAG